MCFKSRLISWGFMLMTLLFLVACGTSLEKPSGLENNHAQTDQQLDKSAHIENPDQTIIHSIVAGEDTLLPPTAQEIEVGDTVLSALIAITRQHNLQLDFRGGQGALGYVVEIANVREFAEGPLSGWIYLINGALPDRGAGVVTLCAGDRVEWIYTTTLGEDIETPSEPFRRGGACPEE